MSAETADGSPAELLDWAAGVLSAAVEDDRARAASAAPAESLRGLVLSADGVRGALAAERAGVASVDAAPPLPPAIAGGLARAGGDGFDAAVVGLALAAALDPAVGVAIAYLQDDVRRQRPSVDLLARMCSSNRHEWTAAVRRLRRDGPLAERGLLEIEGDGVTAEVRPSAVVIRHALGVDEPAPELAGAMEPAVALPVTEHDAVVAAWAAAPGETVLHVHGAEADALAGRVAAALESEGIVAPRVDVGALDPALAPALSAECLLRAVPALLLVPPDGHPTLRRLARSIDAVCLVDPALAVARTPACAAGRPVASVALGALTVEERAATVSARLDRHGAALATAADALPFARRYGLGPDGVEHVAATAAARLRARGRAAATDADLVDVASELAGGPLANLATRVARRASWDDLAAPAGVLDQLHELCARVDVRDVVLDGWGNGAALPDARGVSALFAGPSGTGKTLAASLVASELGLALYRVDLAQVVSKYIGETERNLDTVFSAAESTDVVLLFDEADALFGRRSEVQDAHDRYANLEVAYLLQRMEAYDGVAILATNLLRNLDDAFTRRLDFRVLFPFPGREERRQIWRLVWPAGAVLEDDVDLDALADEHELSGGTIRNAALAAAHLAAAEGGPVGGRHVHHAVAREHEKLGRLPRLLTAAEA